MEPHHAVGPQRPWLGPLESQDPWNFRGLKLLLRHKVVFATLFIQATIDLFERLDQIDNLRGNFTLIPMYEKQLIFLDYYH